MAILVTIRYTNRSVYHVFSGRMNIVQGFAAPEIVLTISAVPLPSAPVPTLRVSFLANGAPIGVIDNSALRCVDAYHALRVSDSLPLAVYAVSPENVLNPTYVDLTTEEQLNGAAYSVTIDEIEIA